MDYEVNKQAFKEILGGVKRDGIDKLLAWLEKSDFYTAPASTRFHLSCEGGLLQHSLNVYEEAMKIAGLYYNPDEITNELADSIAICALCHDLCKTFTYVKYKKNVKNDETGKWSQQDAYKYEVRTPWGHSQKSVIMLQNFIKLTGDEVYAILGHMGFADASFKGGDSFVGEIFEKSKLACVIHMADFMASKIVEVEA